MRYKIYVEGHYVGEAEIAFSDDQLFITDVVEAPRRRFSGTVAVDGEAIEAMKREHAMRIEAIKQAEMEIYERLERVVVYLPPPRDTPRKATMRTRSAREVARGPPVHGSECRQIKHKLRKSYTRRGPNRPSFFLIATTGQKKTQKYLER